MNISRKVLEKNIVERLNVQLFPFGFQHKKTVKDTPNNYYFFEKQQVDFLYRQYIRFMKPNFIKCDSEVEVYNKNIAELVKKISPDYIYGKGSLLHESEEFTILKIGMNYYVHPENKTAVNAGFEWSRMKSHLIYIDDKPVVNVEEKAKEIADTFFKPVIERIIPQTDSLEKIDAILNNFEELKRDKTEPPVLSICYPYSHQFAMGVLLANYLNRSDRKELTDKYVELAKEYGEDRFGYLDLLFKAADYFSR